MYLPLPPKSMSNLRVAYPVLLALVATTLACSILQGQPAATPTPPASETPQATATPPPSPTDTPVPTPSKTPTSTPDLRATAAAKSTQAAEAILAQIETQLQEINRSTQQGHLAWFADEPIDVLVDQYGTTVYVPLESDLTFSDFVLHVEVTWDSKTGFAGCGIIFRSEEDFERGEQYLFQTMRLSGLPAWDVELWRYKEWQSTLTGEIKFSSAIDLAAGSTNEYLLVVEESLLTIYANGSRLGAVTILRRSEGAFAFFAWQESGETTCTFDKAWVWDLTE